MSHALISWFFWWSIPLVEKNRPAPQWMWSWPFQRKRMNGTEWRRTKRMGGLKGLRLGWWRKAPRWRVWWTDGTIQGSEEIRSKQGHLSGNVTHLKGFHVFWRLQTFETRSASSFWNLCIAPACCQIINDLLDPDWSWFVQLAQHLDLRKISTEL